MQFIVIMLQVNLKKICAHCLLKLVDAKVTSPDGSTTQHQKDVKRSFMVDVVEIRTDLRIEKSVKMPAMYVVSYTYL